jgi:hypothetical protein
MPGIHLLPVSSASGSRLTSGLFRFRKQAAVQVFEMSVLRIRIRMFLGLPDPDPSVRDTDPDPDPSIIKQKSKKNLDSYCFVTYS